MKRIGLVLMCLLIPATLAARPIRLLRPLLFKQSRAECSENECIVKVRVRNYNPFSIRAAFNCSDEIIDLGGYESIEYPLVVFETPCKITQWQKADE